MAEITTLGLQLNAVPHNTLAATVRHLVHVCRMIRLLPFHLCVLNLFVRILRQKPAQKVTESINVVPQMKPKQGLRQVH